MGFIKDMKSGLNRNVTFLGVVSGLTDISSEMLYPIIPIFLTSVLGAPMRIVGLIEGTAEATASFLKILGGIWSDRTARRKPFIVAGYALSAVSKPVLALAGTWHLVLFSRFMDRVGKGVRSSASTVGAANRSAAERRKAGLKDMVISGRQFLPPCSPSAGQRASPDQGSNPSFSMYTTSPQCLQ